MDILTFVLIFIPKVEFDPHTTCKHHMEEGGRSKQNTIKFFFKILCEIIVTFLWKIFSIFFSRLVKFHLMRKVYLWSWVNFLKNLLCVSSTLWTWNPCQYIIISEIWIYTLTNLKNVVSIFLYVPVMFWIMKVNKQLTLEKKEMSMKKALNVIINYHSKRIEISYGIIMKSERNTVEGLVFHSQQSQLN